MQCAFYVPICDEDGAESGSRPCPKPSTLKVNYAGENEGCYCFCCDGHRNCAEADMEVASVEPFVPEMELEAIEDFTRLHPHSAAMELERLASYKQRSVKKNRPAES
jgi:hypothetical protein